MYDPARDAFTSSDDPPTDHNQSSKIEAAEHSSTRTPPADQLEKEARASEDPLESGQKILPAKVGQELTMLSSQRLILFL